MIAIVAFTIGVLIATGIHLMSKGDVVKLAAGTVFMTNSAILLLVAAGPGADQAPILPAEDLDALADPLVQALALTAAVIGFGTTVLLLRIALAVERSHGSILMSELVTTELEHGRRRHRAAEEPVSELEPGLEPEADPGSGSAPEGSR